MRRFVLTSMILAASGAGLPAFASSIDLVTGVSTGGTSILQVSCAHCPALAPKISKNLYTVPSVAAGGQSAELVEVDGKQKLKRVESWLGGSPVVFMTSAEGWATKGSVIIAKSTLVDDGIDRDATTAAVAVISPPAGPVPINRASFELRLK